MENIPLNIVEKQNTKSEQGGSSVASQQQSNIANQHINHSVMNSSSSRGVDPIIALETRSSNPIIAKNSHNYPQSKDPKPSITPEKPPVSFESSMNELEKIVAALEGGQLQLETAIQYYARGLELHKHCSDQLENAKLKVQNILHNQGRVTGLQQSPLQDEYSPPPSL